VLLWQYCGDRSDLAFDFVRERESARKHQLAPKKGQLLTAFALARRRLSCLGRLVQDRTARSNNAQVRVRADEYIRWDRNQPESLPWMATFSLSHIPTRFLESAGLTTLALASPPAFADAPAQTASMPTQTVRLTVNGRQFALDLDPRTTLLDALREHLRADGYQEGLRSGTVRRLHGARERNSASIAAWRSR